MFNFGYDLLVYLVYDCWHALSADPDLVRQDLLHNGL